jgi:multiple sugar transport system substrate-binding protein
MKYLFMCVFALLIAASVFTWYRLPTSQYKGTTVYWVTDPNPARVEQIAIFQRWLRKDPKRPQDMRVLVDAANTRKEKKVIQGVSGVGGDTMDMTGGTDLRYFKAIGLIAPVTKEAKALGYDVSTTWDPIRSLIAIDDEQYLYPCNVSAQMIWVDYNQFDELGVEHPPHRWDWDTFERIGRDFVQKANAGKNYQNRFMLDTVDTETMYRSLGLACFNETLTFCQLEDPRYIKALEKKFQWMYIDHITPTAADKSGFDVEAGYGGPQVFLFGQGNYAMFTMGRYSLIRLRQIQQARLDEGKPMMKLGVLEPPHGGFPVTRCNTRALGIYAGGNNIEKAKVFQSYLASEDYNMQIVRDADALPPNPKYVNSLAWEKPLPLLPTQTEILFPYQDDEKQLLSDFRIDFYNTLDKIDRESDWTLQKDLPRPPKPAKMSDEAYQEALAEFDNLYMASMPVYKSEWGMHERFTDLMNNIALPADITPYCVPETVSMEIKNAEDEFINRRATAEHAAKRAADRVNAEIQRSLEENPELKAQYDKARADQKIIDELKTAGKKIPARLIQNPYYLRYYKVNGMLEGEE